VPRSVSPSSSSSSSSPSARRPPRGGGACRMQRGGQASRGERERLSCYQGACLAIKVRVLLSRCVTFYERVFLSSFVLAGSLAS
jgi:hypothetical protein